MPSPQLSLPRLVAFMKEKGRSAWKRSEELCQHLLQHAADPQVDLLVDPEHLAQGIAAGEEFFREFPADDDRIRAGEGGAAVAAAQRESEHPQEGRVNGECLSLVKGAPAALQEHLPGGNKAAGGGDLRDLALQRRRQRGRGGHHAVAPVRDIHVAFDPEEIGLVPVEAVEAQLVQHQHGDQQAAGQAQGQAEDIDEGIASLAADPAPGHLQVVEQKPRREPRFLPGWNGQERAAALLEILAAHILGPADFFYRCRKCLFFGQSVLSLFVELVEQMRLEFHDGPIFERLQLAQGAFPFGQGFIQVKHNSPSLFIAGAVHRVGPGGTECLSADGPQEHRQFFSYSCRYG